jgi:hypothetical protein
MFLFIVDASVAYMMVEALFAFFHLFRYQGVDLFVHLVGWHWFN